MASPTIQIDAGAIGENQGTFISDEADGSCYDPNTRAALIQFAEEKCPTSVLVQSLRYFSIRPIARPHLISREDRLTDRYLWTVYAIEMRRERSRKRWSYLPPCLACATMTGNWCDHCQQALCTQCERERVRCPGCIPWQKPDSSAAQPVRQETAGSAVSPPARTAPQPETQSTIASSAAQPAEQNIMTLNQVTTHGHAIAADTANENVDASPEVETPPVAAGPRRSLIRLRADGRLYDSDGSFSPTTPSTSQDVLSDAEHSLANVADLPAARP